MKKYLINFATPNFYKGQRKLNRSALKFGVDECISFNFNKLKKTNFYRENKEILDQERGSGFWLWKPHIIFETLKKVNNGDIVIYCDSGVEVIADIRPLINICCSIDGLMFFQIHDHTNKKWTKRDCFVLMDADSEEYYNAKQVVASYHLYKKNKKNLEFVEQWLSYCKYPRILTDMLNTCGLENFPELIDHRHDQSILSILTKKYGFEIYRDPSQFGNRFKMLAYRVEGELTEDVKYSEVPFANSAYGTIFYHHRQRNFSITHKVKKLIRGLKSETNQ